MYNERELMKIYNEVSDQKLTFDDTLPILSKFNLIIGKIPMDNIEMVMLIDVLKEFEKDNNLDKITTESLNLLSKIIGNENNEFHQEDALYIPRRLKHLLLPSYLNKCENEYDLPIFLAEFDILLGLMHENMKQSDYELLKKYNSDLNEIIKRYSTIITNYRKSELCKKSGTADIIIVDTTISHLATMLYFGLSNYDYTYDLLNKVTNSIIENYLDFMYYCYTEDVYKDILHMHFNPDNVLKEYTLCNELLQKEFRPPVKVLK